MKCSTTNLQGNKVMKNENKNIYFFLSETTLVVAFIVFVSVSVSLTNKLRKSVKKLCKIVSNECNTAAPRKSNDVVKRYRN